MFSFPSTEISSLAQLGIVFVESSRNANLVFIENDKGAEAAHREETHRTCSLLFHDEGPPNDIRFTFYLNVNFRD